jgi:hypothetical protein
VRNAMETDTWIKTFTSIILAEIAATGLKG